MAAGLVRAEFDVESLDPNRRAGIERSGDVVTVIRTSSEKPELLGRPVSSTLRGEIKDLIDVNLFAGVRMELYQPKVASAEELAEEMGRIMQAYAASATQSEHFVARVISVPRINRLLVISHSEAAWGYAMR